MFQILMSKFRPDIIVHPGDFNVETYNEDFNFSQLPEANTE